MGLLRGMKISLEYLRWERQRTKEESTNQPDSPQATQLREFIALFRKYPTSV